MGLAQNPEAARQESEVRLAAQLEVLADPTRRRILELLKRRGCCSCQSISAADPGLCICDLEPTLGLSQPTITHHVQVLREAGLVATRKIGRWVYCRRNEGVLDRLAAWLREL
jgi:ArsR family transcriptional regulator